LVDCLMISCPVRGYSAPFNLQDVANQFLGLGTYTKVLDDRLIFQALAASLDRVWDWWQTRQLGMADVFTNDRDVPYPPSPVMCTKLFCINHCVFH